EGVGDAGDLRARPTRRSSDLVDRHAYRVALLGPLRGLAAGTFQHPLADRGDQAGFFRQRNEVLRRQQAHGRVLPAYQRLTTADADRKSTRLNSSHVKTSYAGF